MARVRVMYWREIPVQVQAEDSSGQVSMPLDQRFQQGVDSLAILEGSGGGDEYLAAWEWGEYTEVEGNAREVAALTVERFNKGFPEDFAERVRALHLSGQRDTRPGAIDCWIGG